MTPIDPSFLTAGREWSIGTDPKLGDLERGTPSVAGAEGADSFGSMLSKQISSLETLQVDAAEQSRALATGQAADASQVVMAVEKARLAMQLAAQLRTKSVDALSEVMRTQV